MCLKVITDMQMDFFAYDIIKHWQCHHKLDAYKTRKGKTILLGWRSLQSTFSHVHHISLQLKKKNKRCAKLTDGNNGKQFLVTVVMKRRNHFNQTTNSKK